MITIKLFCPNEENRKVIRFQLDKFECRLDIGTNQLANN
jgi:hypothetical protein